MKLLKSQLIWPKNGLQILENVLSEKENKIAQHILKEINERLNFLLNVGLNYLKL